MSVLKGYKGKWKVDITDGIDPLTGDIKRHRKSGFATRKEAVQYEADYRLNKLHQVLIKDKLSVSHLYSLVRQEDELRGNKRGTVDTQVSYYNQYVSKFFKHADMSAITIHEVKDFRDWLVKQPSVKGGMLSSTTINQQMIFLHKMFDVAVAKRLRQDNPCNGLRKLPDKHKEMSYYTPEEFKQFDSLFTDDEYMFQLFYRVLMFTGVRVGEALALTWRQVNLADGYIDIRYSAYFRNNKVHIGTVKTTQSNRRIYIHTAFVQELKEWKEKQAHLLAEFTENPEDLQIFQDSPLQLTAPMISNQKARLQKRMPNTLKMIRNHDFRHSHAAFLVSKGLRNGEGKDYIFFTLMKRLGHSSINTTINIYSHLFPTQQKEVANAFDNF
ncbi:site-specific integrase [Streptococcus parasanguinis]